MASTSATARGKRKTKNRVMKITIRCVNDSKSYEVNEGASLLEIGHQIMPDKMSEMVVGKVNNRVTGLTARVYNNSDIEFSGISSPYGIRTYTRTLLFILSKAVSNLYKGVSVSVEAPISNAKRGHGGIL